MGISALLTLFCVVHISSLEMPSGSASICKNTKYRDPHLAPLTNPPSECSIWKVFLSMTLPEREVPKKMLKKRKFPMVLETTPH
jgi:hypothetical protein